MNKATDLRFTDAVEWARAELSRTHFGEVRLGLIVHGGLLARIEKTVTVKEQAVERIGHLVGGVSW